MWAEASGLGIQKFMPSRGGKQAVRRGGLLETQRPWEAPVRTQQCRPSRSETGVGVGGGTGMGRGGTERSLLAAVTSELCCWPVLSCRAEAGGHLCLSLLEDKPDKLH